MWRQAFCARHWQLSQTLGFYATEANRQNDMLWKPHEHWLPEQEMRRVPNSLARSPAVSGYSPYPAKNRLFRSAWRQFLPHENRTYQAHFAAPYRNEACTARQAQSEAGSIIAS